MSCLSNLLRKWIPSIYEKEVAKQEKLEKEIKFLSSLVDSKKRLVDTLDKGIKELKLEYYGLSSKYKKAIEKLSLYIEKYGTIEEA